MSITDDTGSSTGSLKPKKGGTRPKTNGAAGVAHADPHTAVPDLEGLLAAMQALKAGDFSVRLSGDQIGLAESWRIRSTTSPRAMSAWPSSWNG